MKVNITFKQQNPDFDKAYAETYQGGKESHGNWKDLWSKAFSVENVDKITKTENGNYPLKGRIENIEVDVILPNMTIVECIANEEVIADFAVSKNLVNKTHEAYNGKYDITRFYFYLKNKEDYITIEDNIYILKEELPDVLRTHIK